MGSRRSVHRLRIMLNPSHRAEIQRQSNIRLDNMGRFEFQSIYCLKFG